MSNNTAHPQTVLITGATSGIGKTTAIYLAEHGYHVIATGRRLAALEAVKREARTSIDIVELDVSDEASITAAVQSVNRMTGGLGVDVLVNNAGYGLTGPLAEINDQDLRKQYDTNVFGLMAVTRAFLPQMRERGAGRIINISSVGGRVTFPFMGAYTSTKYAVESLSNALRAELAPFGIQVVLIEPGAINTGFAEVAMGNVAKYNRPDSPYAASLARAQEVEKKFAKMAVGPEHIAKAIHKAIRRRRPAARYVAPFAGKVMLFFMTVLPTRLTDMVQGRLVNLHQVRAVSAHPVSGELSSSAS